MKPEGLALQRRGLYPAVGFIYELEEAKTQVDSRRESVYQKVGYKGGYIE